MKNYVLGKDVNIGKNVILNDGVIIGDNVKIGDFTIVYPNVKIKDNTIIGPFCIIGEPTSEYYREISYENRKTIIGSNSLIRSHTIIYCDTIIGDNFQSGHRVTIREKAYIGNNVRIGTLSDIQGHCKIGNYVSLHSNVHIGQESIIKDYVWIFPYVILTNDSTPPSYNLQGVTVESFAVIATGSILLPGVHIYEDALIGAMSLVKNDVPKEMVVSGNPAKEICSVRKIKNKVTGEPVYPWRNSFKRGMPWEESSYDEWYKKLQIETLK